MEGDNGPEVEKVEIDLINEVVPRTFDEERAARAAERAERAAAEQAAERAGRAARIVEEHFGERMRAGEYGFRLTRDNYAISDTASSIVPGETLSDEWCLDHRRDALENFDLNMEFFRQIPPASFEAALDELFRKYKNFRKISDLPTLDGVGGVYMMVLDEYHQGYIGQSVNMRKRIKEHWTGVKKFDRLLWGNKHKSVMSIDSFRALDTTRIFAIPSAEADPLEVELIRIFPPDYLLNRVDGGVRTLEQLPSLLFSGAKIRNFQPSQPTPAASE